jgi:hypothetical protein
VRRRTGGRWRQRSGPRFPGKKHPERTSMEEPPVPRGWAEASEEEGRAMTQADIVASALAASVLTLVFLFIYSRWAESRREVEALIRKYTGEVILTTLSQSALVRWAILVYIVSFTGIAAGNALLGEEMDYLFAVFTSTLCFGMLAGVYLAYIVLYAV